MTLQRTLVRLVRLAASAAALAALPAQAQNDWVVCGNEGQTCTFNGEVLVRFGTTDGRYAFRVAQGQQPCTVDAFGTDPAPGVRKRCEVSTSWRKDARYRGWRDADGGRGFNPQGLDAQGQSRWRYCASEGGDCVVKANSRVRFGANGRYNTLTVADRVVCNVSTFRDPAPGQPKVCEVEETGPAWVLCANEGATCRLPDAPTTVRYGANGRYVERQAASSIACTNAQFGDPVPGTAKQCEYRSGDVVAAAALPWEFCAHEGDQCSFRGPAMLRYGVAGRFAYREASDGLRCSNDDFGGDPAQGSRKQCERLRIGR
ncbi:MAG TPA: hypothetical protein VFQ20_01295 [Burkholderiaceae bacterium]|nr:hypothetical protein [Burkholderiaceae bacterium]